MKKVKRRKRRVIHDWPIELASGKSTEEQFYKSTDWKYKRLEILERDKNTCQFFLLNWNDGKHFPDEFKIVGAKYVHHIKPLKDYPELCLDDDNLISLSFEAHEIVEDRIKLFINKKKSNIDEKFPEYW